MAAIPKEDELEPKFTIPLKGDIVVKVAGSNNGVGFNIGDTHEVSEIRDRRVVFHDNQPAFCRIETFTKKGGFNNQIWRVMKRGSVTITLVISAIDYKQRTPAEEEEAFRKRRDEMWRKAMS